jgi:hypothetical protein
MRLLTLTLRRKVEGRASNSCSESPPAGTLIMRTHTVSFASCLQIVVDQGRRWCPRIQDRSLAWSSAGNDGRSLVSKDSRLPAGRAKRSSPGPGEMMVRQYGQASSQETHSREDEELEDREDDNLKIICTCDPGSAILFTIAHAPDIILNSVAGNGLFLQTSVL